MDCACNELFARSRFARNEDRRITRRDFGDTRQYAFQSGRCSDNLFKHRGFIDFLAQRDVFMLQSLLGSFAIVDIYGCRIKALNLSLFVPQRDTTGEEPAISSITLAQS